MKRLYAVMLAGLVLLVAVPPAGRGDGPPGTNHQARQPRPIPLGVSGGDVKDKTSQFCCSGTLGALVKQGTMFFILSTSHVLARSNAGLFGEQTDQPGLIDTQPPCQVISADIVATLAKKVPIDFSAGATNRVDAAPAKIKAGQVATRGTILDIGVPSGTPLAPAVNLNVKKSGRNGLTNGTIAAINVTLNVAYPTSCGSSQTKTATFVNQMSITPSTFSAGGDSGALVVEDVASTPRPVGLVFAASSSTTFANVITDVLAALGNATIVSGIAPAAEEARPSGALTTDHPEVAAAIAVQERHQEALLQLPGVVGVGVGLAPGGGAVGLVVYLERLTAELEQAIPAVLDGLPVTKVVTGRVTAR
jgi:hypothetical protein